MSIKHCINLMKCLHNNILLFIDGEDSIEEIFSNLKKSICDIISQDNEYDRKTILSIISNISNNHFRTPTFFNKIEQILLLIKPQILKFFADIDIFRIFRKNKRILLLLIENKILKFDQSITDICLTTKYIKRNYPRYFYTEIKPFLDQQQIENYSIGFDEKFEKNRKIGENENHICIVIRNDDIDEFITYVNKNMISINAKIEISMFETNPMLLKSIPCLIEYAAFFGSNQIFKYLYLNGAQITESLLLYSMHGKDPEILDILINNKMIKFSYNKCIKESVKCHHNEIVNYIQNNYENNDEKNDDNIIINYNDNIFSYSFHYFNFAFIPDECDENVNVFFYLCEYDFLNYLILLLKNKSIDINKSIYGNTTGLHLAASKNNYNIINYLLSFQNIIIGDDCFNKCKFKELKIPSHITSLGKNSFNECCCLENIEIPSSVTSIGKNCFYNCCRLNDIKILSTKLIKIEDSLFEKCKLLKEIIIPNSVTEIGQSAFKECESLEQIKIPVSVKKMKSSAFEKCSSLTKVEILSRLDEIEDSCFSYCENLTQINIPSSTTKIGNSCFSQCYKLPKIVIPSSVKDIGKRAFQNCSLLKLVFFDKQSQIQTINSCVFLYCSSLEIITIPSSVQIIGKKAFYGCSKLSNVNIPPNLQTIYKTSFKKSNFDALQNIPPSVTIIHDKARNCIIS